MKTMRPLALLVALIALFGFVDQAEAKKKTRKKSRKQTAEVPINIGAGPAFYFLTGALQNEQAPHYGIKLETYAIADKKLLKKNRKKVPRKYRKLLKGVDQVRIGIAWIPDSLILSPGEKNTSIYGATWRPLSLGIPLIKNPRLHLGAGLLMSYAYINTDYGDLPESERDPNLPEGTTHFLRPGADLRASVEIELTDTVALSGGWSSAFYVPQALGGGIGDLGEGDDSAILHIGQAFVVLNIRIPHKTKI